MHKLFLIVGVAILYLYVLPGIFKLNNTSLEQSMAQIQHVVEGLVK
jgi:hypothetical protein